MRFCVALTFIVTLNWLPAAVANVFEDAQSAAAAGDYETVISLLTMAIDEHDLVDAELVVAYANRGVAYSLLRAYGRARADLQLANELNPEHALTLNHLGLLSEHVDDDPAAAFAWYRKSADLGFAAAEVNLGRCYREGLGTARDPVRARRVFVAAADKQYVLAYVPLATMMMSGEGGDADPKAAVGLLLQASAEGVVAADFHLGAAYQRGQGVLRDYRKAAEYYRAAAMQGYSPAQNALGYMYRRGIGVEQDFLEAATWYQLAADQGHLQATNRLAWLLSTCPVESVCNGPAAVQLAEALVQEDKTASTLDSLAAAYARSGEYDRAVAVLELLARQFPDQATRYRDRLDLYRQGLPYQL